MKLSELRRLAAQGEGRTLEFKRSTGELREGLQTLCAFLNTAGGRVLFGVDRKGRVQGQHVSEQTLHEVTAGFQRFEPPAPVRLKRIKVGKGREVISLEVEADREAVPFSFDGRPFERSGNTTRRMPQSRYETLLLERCHAKRRWENLSAYRVKLKDLDHEEILRTRAIAIEQRRISAATGKNIGDILDRLGLRENGEISQAAQILYGTKFLSNYPQGLLKLGRFRGTKITGDILDNKQEHMHAFAMVREAIAWLDRILPLGARFPKGSIYREDRQPVPPDALRETILNAVMHRDYSFPGSCVAVAVFDDRIEVQSTGQLPPGITVKMLSKPHTSKLRNPLIAGAFHRTGAVEVWGRGTDRVISACKKWGIPAPKFEERSGSLVVTFRAPIVPDQKPRRGARQVPHKYPTSTPQVPHKLGLLEYCRKPRSIREMLKFVGLKDRPSFLRRHLHPLLKQGLLSMADPEAPRSPKQRYRTTEKGLAALERK